MSTESTLPAYLSGALAPALFGLVFLANAGIAVAASCTGPGAPSNTQTRCLTAVAIPGNPIRSFDISWVDPNRSLYFLADRSNNGVDIISTVTNTWIGRAGGFKGVALNKNGTVNNNLSGPDGVVSHGKWLYAGDGDSTLKVFDISNPANPLFVISIPTGGKTRLDEMALSTDGKLLLAANNAEDPPFVTLFAANGDNPSNSVFKIRGPIMVDSSIVPPGFGLAIEQPAWDEEHRKRRDEATERWDEHRGLFYVSIPTIADNPKDCNHGQVSGPITCSGGLLVIDPSDIDDLKVVPLNECGPNGLTLGPKDNLLAGCTPGNEPSNTSELVINADSFHYVNIGGITGSDEVWFNKGDNRYYTGSSGAIKPAGSALGRGSVLGVINAITNLLIETIPQSSGSHSVAADSNRNSIYVPQVAPFAVVGSGGDLNFTAGPGSATVGQLICGSTSGCVAVYRHGGNEDHEGQKDRK